MLFKRKTDWNLLAKYMAGETDAKETESVLSWAAENAENKALLQDVKSDWQKMDRIDDRFNVDSAWEKLHNRIAGQENIISEPQLTVKPGGRMIRFSIPVRIAASLVLLAILSVAVITSAGRFQRITVASATTEKNRVVDLPDGSKVYLNSGSQLTYSKKFAKNNRDVELSGEAYFEVTPDKRNPFRIYAGNACVKVVGTAFNVNSRIGGIVEVYVENGIVELAENGNLENYVMLQPGNLGIVNRQTVKRSQAKNANAIAWKTGAMTFSDTPLTEVIALLNNVYNVNIQVKGEGFDTIKINGSYQGDPLEDILQVIGQHNPQLTIAKSDDTIYLSQ